VGLRQQPQVFIETPEQLDVGQVPGMLRSSTPATAKTAVAGDPGCAQHDTIKLCDKLLGHNYDHGKD
jgi:hypothetical protein